MAHDVVTIASPVSHGIDTGLPEYTGVEMREGAQRLSFRSARLAGEPELRTRWARALSDVPGVRDALMVPASGHLSVRFDPEQTSRQHLLQTLQICGGSCGEHRVAGWLHHAASLLPAAARLLPL